MNKTLRCTSRTQFWVIKQMPRKSLSLNRLSLAGACFARHSQLALALSKDERFTSLQLVLGCDVADGAVQPFRIVDPNKPPHNASRILQ